MTKKIDLIHCFHRYKLHLEETSALGFVCVWGGAFMNGLVILSCIAGRALTEFGVKSPSACCL